MPAASRQPEEVRALARLGFQDLDAFAAGVGGVRRGIAARVFRAVGPAATPAQVPLLPGATHCFVAATVTRSPRHPAGRLVGDWLVREGSASGRGRTRTLPFDDGHHVGGVHRLALLNHPAV